MSWPWSLVGAWTDCDVVKVRNSDFVSRLSDKPWRDAPPTRGISSEGKLETMLGVSLRFASGAFRVDLEQRPQNFCSEAAKCLRALPPTVEALSIGSAVVNLTKMMGESR